MSELTDFRARKDDFFKNDRQSPLTREQRKDFSGLVYFPENPALRFVTALDTYPEPEQVTMVTSAGDVEDFLRVGRVRFGVGDLPQELQVYQSPGGGSLFLPFVDATAPEETYGAGRYLELEELPDGQLVLDFNYAHNPYCAYNAHWRCPIPNRENRLDVRIEAGEKNPQNAT